MERRSPQVPPPREVLAVAPDSFSSVGTKMRAKNANWASVFAPGLRLWEAATP